MTTILAAYASVLLATVLIDRLGARRPLMVALLPLIFVDCIGNLLLLQSFNRTLSGEAWNQRDHRHWGWCWRAIDAFFFWQHQHCRTQAGLEELHGSVWAAWLHDFMRA